MTVEIQAAEDAFEAGDFIRAGELYRKLLLAPDATDSLLANLVAVESHIVRSCLRRKLKLDPDHVYARVLLAAQVDAIEALLIYTELLEQGNLSPHDRARTLLQRFGLFVSKHMMYSNAASDFLEARRILAGLNPRGMLSGTFATLARINSATAIPVLQEIADGLGDESDAVEFIARKIEELRTLATLQRAYGDPKDPAQE